MQILNSVGGFETLLLLQFSYLQILKVKNLCSSSSKGEAPFLEMHSSPLHQDARPVATQTSPKLPMSKYISEHHKDSVQLLI